MSTIEEHEQDTERPERASRIREVATRIIVTDLTVGDGRTIDARIVPYGERAQANDGLGGVPRGVVYEEEILPGAFDHQLNAAHRVHMNYEHQPGIGGVVGHGVALRSETTGSVPGLYGSFRMHETAHGDTALELVKAGALGGISFEAKFRGSRRAATGVIQRFKADLVNIALCREPAYANAVVLGLRTDEIEDDVVLDEAFLPIQPDPEMLERCRALGIRMPQRYEAHPAITDTPDESGTSEDGTRPNTETTV